MCVCVRLSTLYTCVFTVVHCVPKIVALIRLLMRLHKHNCSYLLLSIDDFCCCHWRCFCFSYLLISGCVCATNKIKPIDVRQKPIFWQPLSRSWQSYHPTVRGRERKKKLSNSIISFNAKTISTVKPLKLLECTFMVLVLFLLFLLNASNSIDENSNKFRYKMCYIK